MNMTRKNYFSKDVFLQIIQVIEKLINLVDKIIVAIFKKKLVQYHVLNVNTRNPNKGG